MRFFACAVCLAFALPAYGQSTAPIVIAPAPPITATPLDTPLPPPPPLTDQPPGLVQTPLPPAGDAAPPANADNGSPPAAAALPALPANNWVNGKAAQLGVLDKVDGSVAEPSIDVGGQSVVGDLQINVLACVTRPPDELPDAAVFLSIQAADNIAGPPVFRGWIVRSTPAAAAVGDAGEALRVIGCT